MIKLDRLLSNSPIPVIGDIKFYQPTVGEILDMGETMYLSLLKIWTCERSVFITEETEETKKLSDFDIWLKCITSNKLLFDRFVWSIDCFLKQKVEFLPMSSTILIGENDSSIILDEQFYNKMTDIAASVLNLGRDEKDDKAQYRETKHMSDREREMMEKMKARESQLAKIKGQDHQEENHLISQVISLVAIGHYTFKDVYDMTIAQLIYLLKKYNDIQQYELYTLLSPYMDSKKNEPVKHWLNT